MKKINILSCLLLITGYVYAAGTLTTSDLRCEHLINPLGIDIETPHLSWKLIAPSRIRNQKQTAYHILVASSPDKLDEGKADIWNSGIVSSQQSHLVPYAGPKLHSGSNYYWRVKVYDNKKNSSEWSAPARFSIGLRHRSDWKGEWIKHPSATPEKHIWFRKKLVLSGKPSATALAYVASLGYHELYVNGRKVDNRVLAPVISRIDKRAMYVTYDIAPLLRKGDNIIAIWYAAGWTRNDYFDKLVGQGLLVQVNGTITDGSHFTLCSDNTWKAAESYSRNTGFYKFWSMGGEEVDGRRYSADWNTLAFNDVSWQTAQTTQPLINGGNLILSAQMTDPSRIIETLPARHIADTVPGVWNVDMGKSFTGFLEARFDGLHAGDTVMIQISNRTEAIEEFNQRQIYIARGEPGETFLNRFNFFAGRYVTFTGLRQKPKLSDVKGYAVSSAAERAGYFECSEPLFNQIYETDRWTYEMCHTEGVVVDCPNRERLGYGMEGAYLTTWGLGLPCFSSASYYIKNIRDWSDVQKEDGRMNYVAPQISDMWGNSMAGSASMNIAYELYNTCGDKRPLEVARETGRKWLDFLFRYLDGDGLLTDYDTRRGFFLGEWLLPKHIQEYNTEEKTVFFNNCSYAMTLDLYIRISEILGKDNETAPYRKRLQTVRTNLHRKYYNPEVDSYLDGDQVRTAFALFAGIVPENLQANALKHLEDDLTGEHPYFNIGSFTRYPYYHVLFAHPQFTDIIYNVLSRTEWPGYGYFISKGETAWPETWEIDEDKSSAKLHTGNTGISAWFIKSIAGIEPVTENPGYQAISIRPHIVEKIKYAKAGVETPYGLVESGWRKENGNIWFDITVPVNTEAIIILPDGTQNTLGSGKHNIKYKIK
jgi:alpha-L-rhamnosidase